MANITFKSITFPGLPNKYTVPEISSDLMTAGKAADAKATGDALSALEDAVTEETDKLKADLGDTNDNVNDLKSTINSKSNATIRTVSGETAVPVYANKAQENAVKSLVLSGAATSGCNRMIILDGSSDENWTKVRTNEYGLVNYAWYFGATLGLVKNNFGYTSKLKMLSAHHWKTPHNQLFQSMAVEAISAYDSKSQRLVALKN